MSNLERVRELLDLTEKRHRLWGICSFHEEKTPSFMVDPREDGWYCFGCQKGGSLEDLLARLEKS